MGVTIQINSVEALERLIGNDTELEIQLRNSVVQEFTNRHLKKLATLDLMNNASQAVQQELKDHFFTEIKNSSYYSPTLAFKPEILAKLKNSLKDSAEEDLKKLVSQVIDETNSYETVKKQLEETTDWIIKQLGPEKLAKMIDRLVDARIKDKLGLS